MVPAPTWKVAPVPTSILFSLVKAIPPPAPLASIVAEVPAATISCLVVVNICVNAPAVSSSLNAVPKPPPVATPSKLEPSP